MVPQYGLDPGYRQGKEERLALIIPCYYMPSRFEFVLRVTVTIEAEHADNSRVRSRMDNT